MKNLSHKKMMRRTLRLNGLKHQLYTWGDPSRPALFCIHGWMDTGASFQFLAETLCDHFYCIAIDLRGFGRSAHTSNSLGYFFYEYIADVHALLAALSPDAPVRLLGHSMGGNIVSLYSGTFPERVSHLINVEGFGARNFVASDGPSRMRQWIESAASCFRPYPTLDAVAERLVASNKRLPMARARRLAPYLSRKTKAGYVFRADPRHKWVSPYLYQLETVYPFWEAITAKCLLVWAQETEIAQWMKPGCDLDAELKMRFAHYPRHAQIIKLESCGHMIHHECPEVLAQHVRSFLTDV